jgi:hypothetical protein
MQRLQKYCVSICRGVENVLAFFTYTAFFLMIFFMTAHAGVVVRGVCQIDGVLRFRFAVDARDVCLHISLHYMFP